MSWVDVLGYAASATVLATFSMSTMIPLRILALGSNVLFFSYGYFDHLYPVLILHAILFPVNLLRLVQFQRLVRDVQNTHCEGLSIESLLPYMTTRNLAAGEILIHKGEKADRRSILKIKLLGLAFRQFVHAAVRAARDRGGALLSLGEDADFSEHHSRL